jgi:tRNA-specific 2-thiouridylase
LPEALGIAKSKLKNENCSKRGFEMKVFVGLSGGVDSSVAAALLVEQGYDVVGVYMKNWSRDVAGHHCPWQEDLASARSVAAHLQIPLKIYDFEKEYYESVTQYMLDAYKQGLTPNPDVMCNQKIKFDTFYKQCLKDGADYVATGHYARLSNQSQRTSLSDPPDSTRRSISTTRLLASDIPRISSELDTQEKQVVLMVAKDSSKDQTYFLYRMNPSVASKALFPIGGLHKTEVRELATKHNLPTAKRPDSQGLCFVGNVPMRDFLGEFIKPSVGNIVDEQGTKLGEHDGAFSYTIGQRHGLGIGGGKPYFVYEIDTKLNIVRVTSDENSRLLNKSEFVIADCMWWQSLESRVSSLEVRVRYRSKSIPCTISRVISTKSSVTLSKSEESGSFGAQDGKKGVAQDDRFKVVLKQPERAIAPGQSAVFYDGDIVVGGGIIQ